MRVLWSACEGDFCQDGQGAKNAATVDMLYVHQFINQCQLMRNINILHRTDNYCNTGHIFMIREISEGVAEKLNRSFTSGGRKRLNGSLPMPRGNMPCFIPNTEAWPRFLTG